MYNIDIRGSVFICMKLCKQMTKIYWKRQKMWNKEKELKDLWNFLKIMAWISNYIFFKKSFLGCLV